MTHRTGHGSSRPALRLAGLLLVLAAALTATSCSKKITDVDVALSPPDYPEGVPASAELILYPDVPVTVETWVDNGDPGPDAEDTLLSSELVYSSGAGDVLGLIVDRTDASSFEVFRRQGTNGYLPLNDFAVQKTRTWLESQIDVFHFADKAPYPVGQREYIARGVVSNVVTPRSPLTNRVTLTATSVTGSIDYTGRVVPDTTRDSTFVVRWNSVANAAGYWITVTAYPPSFLSNDALIRFALPRPIVVERIPDIYVAYVPATGPAGGQPMQQKLGDPLPAGSLLLHEDIGTNGALHFVRIAAVDAQGQLLAYIGDDGAYALAAALNAEGRPVSGQYRLFPINGVFVQPQREPPPPPELATAGPAPSATLRSYPLQPGVRLYDGADLRRTLRR